MIPEQSRYLHNNASVVHFEVHKVDSGIGPIPCRLYAASPAETRSIGGSIGAFSISADDYERSAILPDSRRTSNEPQQKFPHTGRAIFLTAARNNYDARFWFLAIREDSDGVSRIGLIESYFNAADLCSLTKVLDDLTDGERQQLGQNFTAAMQNLTALLCALPKETIRLG